MEELKSYTIPSFGLLLRDAPEDTTTDVERQFNDLYHLFLNRFARLSHDTELSEEDGKKLVNLLEEVIVVKRKLSL